MAINSKKMFRATLPNGAKVDLLYDPDTVDMSEEEFRKQIPSLAMKKYQEDQAKVQSSASSGSVSGTDAMQPRDQNLENQGIDVSSQEGNVDAARKIEKSQKVAANIMSAQKTESKFDRVTEDLKEDAIAIKPEQGAFYRESTDDERKLEELRVAREVDDAHRVQTRAEDEQNQAEQELQAEKEIAESFGVEEVATEENLDAVMQKNMEDEQEQPKDTVASVLHEQEEKKQEDIVEQDSVHKEKTVQENVSKSSENKEGIVAKYDEGPRSLDESYTVDQVTKSKESKSETPSIRDTDANAKSLGGNKGSDAAQYSNQDDIKTSQEQSNKLSPTSVKVDEGGSKKLSETKAKKEKNKKLGGQDVKTISEKTGVGLGTTVKRLFKGKEQEVEKLLSKVSRKTARVTVKKTNNQKLQDSLGKRFAGIRRDSR